MKRKCAYFGIVVLFAAQLYGVELSIQQQIMLVVQATFLSVGCAATPQIGLVISLTFDDADGTSAGCIRTGSWNLSYHRPDSHIY